MMQSNDDDSKGNQGDNTKADSGSDEDEIIVNGVINQNASKKKNAAKQAKLRKEL
jgi:hypothetical protein